MESKYSDNEEYQALDSFAKETGRSLSFSKKFYNSSRQDRYPKYRTEAYIPNSEAGTSFFVCLYDTLIRVGEHAFYSGTFIPVSVPDLENFNIRKRTVIDRFSTLFIDTSYKTTSRDFDSKVVITGNFGPATASYLSDRNVQRVFLKAFEISQTMQISLNQTRADFVPELKNKSQIGIYDKQKWFMDKDEINRMFEIIEELREVIR